MVVVVDGLSPLSQELVCLAVSLRPQRFPSSAFEAFPHQFIMGCTNQERSSLFTVGLL